MRRDDECAQVLRNEIARHAGWHVCHNAADPGMTDYSADDDHGLEPCPLYRAMHHALFDMERAS